MNERERRIGQNEALFRHVNERLRDVNDAFGSVTGDFEIVCECGDVDCAERIMLTAEEYRDVRADPRPVRAARARLGRDSIKKNQLALKSPLATPRPAEPRSHRNR